MVVGLLGRGRGGGKAVEEEKGVCASECVCVRVRAFTLRSRGYQWE